MIFELLGPKDQLPQDWISKRVITWFRRWLACLDLFIEWLNFFKYILLLLKAISHIVYLWGFYIYMVLINVAILHTDLDPVFLFDLWIYLINHPSSHQTAVIVLFILLIIRLWLSWAIVGVDGILHGVIIARISATTHRVVFVIVLMIVLLVHLWIVEWADITLVDSLTLFLFFLLLIYRLLDLLYLLDLPKVTLHADDMRDRPTFVEWTWQKVPL